MLISNNFLDKDLSVSGEGVPVAIKDNISVKGWELTSASKILQGYIAPYDASVIVNLKANGFSPFGRCNMDELLWEVQQRVLIMAKL